MIRDVSEVAASLRRGDCTSQEVVEAQLQRIARFNPPLNAIVTLDAEGARRQAIEADAVRARGEPVGPLHGVPITIKDSFDTRGLRTVSGHAGFRNRVPGADAAAVARLRLAGAIILGKTNLPPLANGIQTENPVFGRTNNPWDLGRTPGGSSGGAAAAVAAGLSYLDLGSDIGGSIRIPAHFCGVFGLKTTAGRLSGRGHVASVRPLTIPEGWEALRELAAFGPLARSVGDLRIGLLASATAGDDALAAMPGSALGRPLRIAATWDFGGAPLDSESRSALQGFALALRDAGLELREVSNSGFDFEQAWWAAGICLGAMNTLFQPTLTRWQRRLLAPLLAGLNRRDTLVRALVRGAGLDRTQIRFALERRSRFVGEVEQIVTESDVWLCPVFPTAAFTHRSATAPIDVDGRPVSQLRANLLHSIIFNLTGHPVVTIPAGRTTSGLPVGVQAVGRHGRDEVLLDAAERLVAAAHRYEPPPGY